MLTAVSCVTAPRWALIGSLCVPHAPVAPPYPPAPRTPVPMDAPDPLSFPDSQLPDLGPHHAIWVSGGTETSIGPVGPQTGTSTERGTDLPDSNLTEQAPSGSDLVPPAHKPVRSVERQRHDADGLDGTHAGPAQPQ